MTATDQAATVTIPLLIDGRDVDGPITEVRNPARLTETVGGYATGDGASVDAAVAAAEAAFPGWAARPARDRAAALTLTADAIDADLANLSTLLTREHGKILADATAEIANTARTLRYYTGLADYASRETTTEDHRGRIVERRAAMGVVAVIVPWNYPVLLATLMIAPALVAGNTVVVKLPDNSPLALALVLRRLASAVEPGVVNVVAGSGQDVGAALTTHPRVRKVSFTGSTATGRAIMRDASVNLKNLSLELGGNDPAIVLDSATVDAQLIDELVRGAFTSTGQVCYAPKRLYVHRNLFDEFTEAFTAATDTLVVGDGLDPAVRMGPLNNRQQHRTVTDLIQASRSEGASVAEVGQYLDADADGGYFLRPTIVTGLRQNSALVQQEQFGPVVPILAYDTEDEAIALANDSEYGLAASVWSDDVDHAFDVGRRIQAGSVFVNIHRVGASDPSMPFGGFKQSGIGRGHGEIALDEASEVQILADRIDMHTKLTHPKKARP
ncbi:aldehyde dehydrogenase family protein [Mycolicibacterium sediminis]|uniref:Aldehyde dehydrogenase n=1 Tax=Mycolicibacterium sediminis TaxID=1286180 RepID=A0A7I7QWL1_9MYCO|nr:aldehyde dehydrogenase family protein [Mycolicibacterium sediminis]BBY30350.1 aldehyde dehydrogenase [Mycolicibacterium sediminis]